MIDSKLQNKDCIDREILEDINQLKRISLGVGAATCQVCGSSFCEGDSVVVYVFRPAGRVMFQIRYVTCCNCHEWPEVFTLGVRELVVAGRVGWCSDVARQSSWPVLLAPDVLAVSDVSTKSMRKIPSDDDGGMNETIIQTDDELQDDRSVKPSLGEARRRGCPDGDVVFGLFWGGKR